MINTCTHCNREFHRPHFAKTCSNECYKALQSKNSKACNAQSTEQDFDQDLVDERLKVIPLKEGFFDWCMHHAKEIKEMHLTHEELDAKMFKITEKQYNRLSKETKLMFQV